MGIELVTKFLPYVDEKFSKESKIELLTNHDFDFTGANIIRIYKISTAEMNDYIRHPVENYEKSRYGTPKGLDATTETFMITRDRSFTFVIDKLDTDETAQQLEAAKCLNRQLKDVIIPEVDTWTYFKMISGAGHNPEPVELTAQNIYTEIIKANEALDNADVPETERVLTVTPLTYMLMKQCKEIIMETDIGNDMRIKGVIGNLDGAQVIKTPAKRLPENFGFMLSHKCATVAPTKLADYKIHLNPPGISGSLTEGRIVYDAFVLDNKKKAIYYQQNSASTPSEPTETEDPPTENDTTE